MLDFLDVLMICCSINYGYHWNVKSDTSEMNLWTNIYFIMIIYVVSTIYRCSCKNNRNERKRYIGKEYCERKRLIDEGKTGEVVYNSFLWSVERPGSPPTYLFGTIHAPSHLVWRYIPQNSQAALFDATHVYTEVDLKDPNVITSIRNCRQLPSNVTLKQVLPKPLFDKFKKVLQKFKASSKKWRKKLLKSLNMFPMHRMMFRDEDLLSQYTRLKPMWLTSTILQQWNRFYIKQQMLQLKSPYPHLSLDSELVRLASDTYKGGIEEVSSHCDPMDNLGTDKVNLALNVTLQALDRKLSGRFHMKENDIRRVINLYKCGDPMNTNRLETLFRDLVSGDMQKKLAEIDEYLLRELMLKRNLLMANRIEKMLKDREFNSARMFFAVGAAHLLGNDSVVSHLRKRGFTVRHIKSKEEIPATIKITQFTKVMKKFPDPNKTTFWWKPHAETEPGIEENVDNRRPNLIIITKVEKNYVYYYSSSTRTRPPDQTTLLLTVMMTVMVWLLSRGC